MLIHTPQWQLDHPDELLVSQGSTFPSLRERLESKFVRGSVNQCWLWLASVNMVNDRPYVNVMGQNIVAARVVFYLEHSYMPKVVRHTCDNGMCVNINHLVGGTQADNLQDMVDRGRHWLQGRDRCDNGHEFTPENTTTRKASNARVCKECARARNRAYYARKAAK